MNGGMERPVGFQSGQHALLGILGRPSRPEPGGRGVVLIHGWGGYRIGPHRILVHTARRLMAEGYHTLRFDLPGRGDSEGAAEKTCLDDMIQGALAAADFLSRETAVKSVTLLGICSGANVAIGAATRRPGALQELVLWSALPFQPQQRARQRRRRAWFYLGRYARKMLRAETWKRLVRGDVNLRMVGRAVAGEKRPAAGEANLKDSSRDIMSAFSAFTGRSLFITGAKDPEGMEGRELFDRHGRANGLDAEFHLVAGATHSFYDPAHESEVIERTMSWLTM